MTVQAATEAAPVTRENLAPQNMVQAEIHAFRETLSITPTTGSRLQMYTDVLRALSAMNIDPEGLRHHVAQVNHQLRGGLLGICLWSQGAGVSIVGDTRQDTTLFGDRVLARTLSSLDGSGFPGLASFMLFTLDDGSVLVLVRHEDHLLELLHVDAQRSNVGLMLSVVIPAARAAMAAAIVH